MWEGDECGPRQGQEEEDEADEEGEDFRVEAIIGERGNLPRGTKEYKVKWVGYPQDHDSWVAVGDLYGCGKILRQWHREDARMQEEPELVMPEVVGEQGDGPRAAHGPDPARRGARRRVQPDRYQAVVDGGRLIRDIQSYPRQQGFEQLCLDAGVDPAAVLYVHCSPPCETFSPADSSNAGKSPPCNYRDPQDPLREPVQRGEGCPYRTKALEHDALVQHIISWFWDEMVP